jgi:cholesterol transport system auxiliary component
MLVACSPIKTLATNQYKLESFDALPYPHKKTTQSLLISQPEAMAGYQTDQMLYLQKPFEMTAFVHNTWISPPAGMLYPLLMQSLQQTGYFYAVASGPYVEKVDYRLDTQLIELQQNFLTKPSKIDMVVKAILTHVNDNRLVSSRIFTQHIPCPIDTPYGGVIAANSATKILTATVSTFVIAQVQRDRLRSA